MKENKTKRETIIEILRSGPNVQKMTKDKLLFTWNTDRDHIMDESPQILPIIEDILLNHTSQLLAEESHFARGNISVLLRGYFREASKHRPQKMSEILRSLPEDIKEIAIVSIYGTWGPSNPGTEDQTNKKTMDKELWLTWLELAEKQESLEWGIQFMKDEIEKGLLLLTPS
mgnify:CR=1 FL=1|tara:strand:+ start:241 stop:756 length:516 start_codon:yes stop_codon:yes gene_type:complete